MLLITLKRFLCKLATIYIIKNIIFIYFSFYISFIKFIKFTDKNYQIYVKQTFLIELLLL